MRFAALLLALLPLWANAAEPIKRDRSQVHAFRAVNPCPATGLTRGACPDRPENMQWITREDHRFKTFLDVKERRERRANDRRVKNN